MGFDLEIEEEIKTEGDCDSENLRHIVVYNDDFNTFDHVIRTLIKVCNHNVHQAEQCTYIIHYRGKCSVKKGRYEMLKPMKEHIVLAGIKAVIV